MHAQKFEQDDYHLRCRCDEAEIACASGSLCHEDACVAVGLSGDGIAVAQGCVEMQGSWWHVVLWP